MAVPSPVHARLLVRPSWEGEAGIRRLLAVALPLIISHASHSLNLFLDRVFLAWYSKEAFSAALQAGFLNWAIVNLFFGLIAYAGTFVAQYVGAGRPREVGAAVWQGIYLTLASGAVLAFFALPARPFFAWIGHEGVLPDLETRYFQILCFGAWSYLGTAALSCFYTGRGKTIFVMLVNGFIQYCNVVLNTWLIFDPPALFRGGVEGAAVASILANVIGIGVYAVAMFRERHEREYALRSAWRPRWGLIRQMVRFGLPAGLHQMVDMTAFATFMLVVGKFGLAAQFASNAAMNINLLLFIPIVGLHSACVILSGQFAGAGRPDLTERMTAGAMLLTGCYILLQLFIYVGVPGVCIVWFRGNLSDAEWRPLLELTRLLLLFVAFYSIFDAVSLVYAGTIKGAGDTRFVMLVSFGLSQALLFWPCVALATWRESFAPRTGLLLAWTCCALFILSACGMFVTRYRRGKWMTMRVIEEDLVAIEAAARTRMDESGRIHPAV